MALVVVSAAPLSAARAEPSVAERAIAESMFDRGRAQMNEGQMASACESFAESQRLDPGTGTLLNLAACHEQAGRLASAWVEFREAVVALRREGRPDRLRYALDRLADIEPRLAYLTINVPEAPYGQAPVVRLDGRELGPAAWGVAIPVDAGWHEARAQASAGGPWRATMNIRDRERRVFSVPEHVSLTGLTVGDEAPPLPDVHLAGDPRAAVPLDLLRDASPAPKPARVTADGRRVAGVVMGGVGLAALGVGSYFGWQASRLWRDRNGECPMDLCSTEGTHLGSRADTAATVATWTVAGGVVALGAAALLFFLPRSSPAATTTVRVERNGISLGGVF